MNAQTQEPIFPAPGAAQRWLMVVAVVAVVALVGMAMLWQRIGAMQENLARQSADHGVLATEARASAKQAQDMALESAAKLSMMEARLNEVALQRSQLEELMQSLSRSRDENLVVDIESALRLAQQQAQLTGSIEPLLAALKTADTRITRAAQPRLAALQRAIAKDVARIKGTALADTPSLLLKIDEIVAMMDEIPLANAVATPRAVEPIKRRPDEAAASWWLRVVQTATDELRNLVRVSRITEPESALLSPEQSFFVRENLKLRMLNARMGLLARQIGPARSDLTNATTVTARYFDMQSRKTQACMTLLQQVQSQMKALDVPRLDDTLAALTTAAAGR